MFRRKFTAVTLLLLAAALAAHGQTTFATVTGTVTDQSGAVVAEAKVTATNVATGIETSALSNAEGVYTLSQLLDGTYRLRVSRQGFKEFRVQDVRLTARDVRRVEIGRASCRERV